MRVEVVLAPYQAGRDVSDDSAIPILKRLPVEIYCRYSSVQKLFTVSIRLYKFAFGDQIQGLFGSFGPLIFVISTWPSKGTSLRQFALSELFFMDMRLSVQPGHASKKPEGRKRHTNVVFHIGPMSGGATMQGITMSFGTLRDRPDVYNQS